MIFVLEDVKMMLIVHFVT